MKTKMTLFLLLLLVGSIYSQTTLITNLQVAGAVSISSVVTKPWSKVVNADESIVITDGKAIALVLRSTVTITNLTVTPTYAEGVTGPASLSGDFSNPVIVQVTHEGETKNVEVTVVTIAPSTSLPYSIVTLQNWSNTTLGVAPVGAFPHSSNYTALYNYQNAALVFAYDGKAEQLKARSWSRSNGSWVNGDIFDFEWSADGQTWTLAKRFDASNPLFCANVASLTGENAQEGYITVPIDGSARYVRARLTATSGTTICLRDIEIVKQSGKIESISLPDSPNCVSGYIHTLPTASTPGEVDMILYPFIDLSNVTISPVFSNAITSIASLPTNFLNEQTLSLTCDGETTDYKVRLKSIRPASETISLVFNATSKQPSNWTADVTNAENYAWSTGWASALFRDKDGVTGGNTAMKNAAQFYATNSCLVFAFDYNAKISYKLASISTTISSTTRFDVESSVDGIQWTLIKEYIYGTTRPTGATDEVYNIPKDHRLIRFKMKNKGTSGNFHLISATVEPRALTGEETTTGLLIQDSIKVTREGSIYRIMDDRAVKSISIYSLNGSRLSTIEGESTIDMKHYAKGIYLATVVFDNNKISMIKLAN